MRSISNSNKTGALSGALNHFRNWKLALTFFSLTLLVGLAQIYNLNIGEKSSNFFLVSTSVGVLLTITPLVTATCFFALKFLSQDRDIKTEAALIVLCMFFFFVLIALNYTLLYQFYLDQVKVEDFNGVLKFGLISSSTIAQIIFLIKEGKGLFTPSESIKITVCLLFPILVSTIAINAIPS